ncbi:hypothetical protein TRFO_03694 [Tritrichomonas foetus]|uniref:Uncharacterized protein n=1 Tax=Tritrichomonas foetus TaxID=1144522 RepID=A0A1J4KMC7_9EUKA|nr:hypothetical protein TRFO_03694 [Tritrichomonas foetus]|eukprot:OHT12080.1 hypothetical protein TRFO_03694 [Tritrichomonas foetus]
MKLNRNIRIAKSKPIIKLNPSIEDDEYFNYTKVLKNLKYRDFLIYLINNKCPYHDSLKEELIPCKITREECCNTLKLIFEKYHDNPLIFTTYPIFSITYICGLLNVVTTLEKNLNVTKDAIIFITSFLKDVQVSFQQNGRRNDKEFESVLDFIIPTFLYNASNDSTSSKMTFILYLIEFFGVNILLHHLMNFLETVVEIKSMITRFHLNILNTISERYIIHNGNIKRMRDFALNMIESKNAEQVKILLRTLEESDAYSYSNHDDSRNHDKDEASDELSQQTPISKSSDNNIHSFYSHRRTASCNLKKSNSNYPFVSSPLLLSSSRKNREFPIESLGSLIDKIEHEPNLADEELIQSLNQIRGQLVQQKIFPINHDFRKILDISFGLYNKYDTENVKITDEQTIIFLLISTMNSICDSQQLLHYYLATKSNMISQNKNFIEQCYQHFLKTSNIQNNNFNSNIPFSLVSQNDLQNYLREDVEFAFTCLNH